MYSPIYINRNGYTVVGTPHFMEMCAKRADIKPTNISENFDKMYSMAEKNVRCGSYFDSGCYVYYRKIWNDKRLRNELELISMTPSEHFHTKNHNFAVMIDLGM